MVRPDDTPPKMVTTAKKKDLEDDKKYDQVGTQDVTLRLDQDTERPIAKEINSGSA